MAQTLDVSIYILIHAVYHLISDSKNLEIYYPVTDLMTQGAFKFKRDKKFCFRSKIDIYLITPHQINCKRAPRRSPFF